MIHASTVMARLEADATFRRDILPRLLDKVARRLARGPGETVAPPEPATFAGVAGEAYRYARDNLVKVCPGAMPWVEKTKLQDWMWREHHAWVRIKAQGLRADKRAREAWSIARVREFLPKKERVKLTPRAYTRIWNGIVIIVSSDGKDIGTLNTQDKRIDKL